MALAQTEKFKTLFRDASELSRDDLRQVYAPHVTFKDPLHHINGLERLYEYFDRMYSNVHSCRFDYLDEIVSDGHASIKWDMRLRHPKLARGEEIVVRGATFIEFDELIFSHEDIFDVGALLYENVPLLATPVKFLKNRLGKA